MVLVTAAIPRGRRSALVVQATGPDAEVSVDKQRVNLDARSAGRVELTPGQHSLVVARHGEELLRRGHLWDTRTGRCRTEDKTATGEPAVVLFNSGTRQGVAYANGEKMPEATSAKAIAGEYAVLLTDTYWLAMPWKWLDPGVNLKYMGRKKRGAHMYDVVELTFDHGVGPTSGDRYEAYVSPETHLMEHWDYVLENGTKGSWDWQYTTTHGMKLASNHTDAKDDAISMGDVRVLDSVDDAFFTDPGKNLAQLGK